MNSGGARRRVGIADIVGVDGTERPASQCPLSPWQKSTGGQYVAFLYYSAILT
jgi:hypothetical protein